MNDMSQPPIVIDSAPLENLYLHPLNTRTEPPALDIEALADSILASGLLQNLLVYLDPDHEGLGVVAGGRRLRALQLLASRGQWSGHVPCQLTHDLHQAQLWANVENSARTELHPADEIRAYGKMAATGSSPIDIAKAFAVPERAVKQRLRLAHLPDSTIDGLKVGKFSLDQLYSLTLANSPEQLAEVSEKLEENPRLSDWQIKRMIVGEMTNSQDRRAKFVTVELYEAEGGKTTRDLFSSVIYLHDESLLNRLFSLRLGEEAERIREEGGWSFVLKTHAGGPYDDKMMADYRIVQPEPAELPEGDQAEFDELAGYDDLDDDQLERFEELEARLVGSFDDDARSKLGCAVYVDYSGNLQTLEGVEKKPAKEADEGGSEGTKLPAEEPDLSQALREDFLTIRRAAIQTALLLKPELMLDLVAFQLDWAELHGGFSVIGSFSADRQNPEPSVADGLAIVGALQKVERVDFANPKAADLKTFRAQESFKKRRNEILTTMFARSVMAMPGELTDLVEELAQASIRSIWQPNLANCFGRLGNKMLVATYAELLEPEADDERFAAFQAMKKKDKAKELDDLFNTHELREAYGLSRETNQRIDAWVPEIMRRAV